MLSTFGLISAGKGIETAIAALPTSSRCTRRCCTWSPARPIRRWSRKKASGTGCPWNGWSATAGSSDNVQFLDRFLSMEELAVLLSSTDLYLTPYRSREQIVSGALTFAVVAGCPVVSTPYFYAEDLLASGAGILVPFDDPTAFAEGVLQLLDNPAQLAAAAREARRVGAGLAWPAVGRPDGRRAAARPGTRHAGRAAASAPAGVASSPSIRSDHLLTLVDDVGIVQHADGVVPNRASGYCVDDVARLVIVALGLDRESDDRHVQPDGAPSGLSFLRYAWDPGRHGMHNLMAYDRRWLDEPHSGDHLGRAVWALGAVVAAHPPRAVAAPSLRLLEELADRRRADRQPRARWPSRSSG